MKECDSCKDIDTDTPSSIMAFEKTEEKKRGVLSSLSPKLIRIPHFFECLDIFKESFYLGFSPLFLCLTFGRGYKTGLIADSRQECCLVHFQDEYLNCLMEPNTI